MSQFTNATIQKAANIYYDGKVTSRTVILEDGTKVTLGIMLLVCMNSARMVPRPWKFCPVI